MKAAVFGGVLVVFGLCAGCATQRISLDGGSATLHGNLKYSAERNILINWDSLEQFATWMVDIPQSGDYEVAITYACPLHISGSEVSITIGDQILTKRVHGTNGWNKYITETVGNVSLTAGTHEVKIMPTEMPYTYVMRMKEISLSRR